MAYDNCVTETNTDKLILQRVRDRIARGWCEHEMLDADSNVCLVGALWLAVGGDEEAILGYDTDCLPAPSPAVDRLVRILGFEDVTDAIEWNDDHKTSRPLLKYLDSAIARLSIPGETAR